MAVGKNITWKKKIKGEQYHLPYNIEAVWKINTKWGKGRKFGGRIIIKKILGWGRISSYIHHCFNL